MTALSTGALPIDVTRGGGEFGRGFYTTSSKPTAWSWAVGRFSLRGAVLEVEFDTNAYAVLAKKTLTFKDALALTARLRSAKTTKSFLCGTDVVIGPIAGNAHLSQEKFETKASELTLNDNTLTQLRVFRG